MLIAEQNDVAGFDLTEGEVAGELDAGDAVETLGYLGCAPGERRICVGRLAAEHERVNEHGIEFCRSCFFYGGEIAAVEVIGQGNGVAYDLLVDVE